VSSARNAFANEALRLRDEFGLNADLIARATDAAPRVVHDWLNRRSSPTGVTAERISELVPLAERLQPIVGTDGVSRWLGTPVAALDHQKPIDVIAGGDCLRVSRLISTIEDPAPHEHDATTCTAYRYLVHGCAYSVGLARKTSRALPRGPRESASSRCTLCRPK